MIPISSIEPAKFDRWRPVSPLPSGLILGDEPKHAENFGEFPMGNKIWA
jgi:hypothetical protein